VSRIRCDDSGEDFVVMIAKTGVCHLNEESRYTLNGALLLLKPARSPLVATDGHRLAVAETTISLRG